MKIPLSLLKEYVDLPFSSEEIAKTLTLAGIEVDEIKTMGSSFSGVIVGKVLETSPHPNADRLKVAQVSDGKDTFQVVCGASNCREGIIVAFAKIGATLPDPEGKTWKIKKSKIRDVESSGMLCASDELGLSGNSDGILELSNELTLGTDLSSIYADVVFDLSLTPNLGHCMSVYGVARELSAFFKTPLQSFQLSGTTPSLPSDLIQVCIEDEINCPRYGCQVVQSLEVGPSPDWLIKKLDLLGLKSINNVVDVSNYVMMLTGQPIHFFDYDLISEGKKVFISSSSTAQVKTLDGVERTIPTDALVIRDENKILAIAGIMGCSTAEVSTQTKNILIEAAIFHPTSIRKTSKALGLKTDASQRFEKGVDLEAIPLALNLAVDLLHKTANGHAACRPMDFYKTPLPLKKIRCRKQRVHDLLGLTLSLGEIRDMLERLQMLVEEEALDALNVTIPSYRNDINEEIDLIEEIARLYGFNNIPKSAARHISSFLSDAPIFSSENKARDLLLGEGLQEFLMCDLTSPSLIELTKEHTDKTTETISVLQSKSSDYSILRPSLLPPLLQMVKYNFDHKNKNISGFEVGRIHFKQKESFQERSSIGIILSGLTMPHHHSPKPRDVDFFDLKGIVENLLAAFKIENVTFEVSHLHNFQPGRQARLRLGDSFLGALGEIHPRTLAALDLPQRVYFAEIDLQELCELNKKNITTQPLPTFPSSERDWTVSLRKDFPIGDVLSCIKSFSSPILENVFLLDIFESEKIGTDRKNATWHFVYRDKTKTLDFESVENEHAKLILKVAEKLGNCIL